MSSRLDAPAGSPQEIYERLLRRSHLSRRRKNRKTAAEHDRQSSSRGTSSRIGRLSRITHTNNTALSNGPPAVIFAVAGGARRRHVEIFQLGNRKIVEPWDVIQPVPETAANPNTMF